MWSPACKSIDFVYPRLLIDECDIVSVGWEIDPDILKTWLALNALMKLSRLYSSNACTCLRNLSCMGSTPRIRQKSSYTRISSRCTQVSFSHCHRQPETHLSSGPASRWASRSCSHRFQLADVKITLRTARLWVDICGHQDSYQLQNVRRCSLDRMHRCYHITFIGCSWLLAMRPWILKVQTPNLIL